MNEFPKTFQDWVTQHISDFNGCNRYLSRWKPSVKHVCPSCGLANEDAKHITPCRDTSRTTLFMEGIEELRSWLVTNHTPPHLASLIHTYLSHRGESSMESLTPPHSPYLTLAQAQDLIDFDNLLVGRLPKALINIMSPILTLRNQRKVTIDRWAKDLSRHLLLFTHRQWTYRNSTVHYKPSEGKTVAEHTMVDEQVRSLLQLSPILLAPQHRYLLTEENRTTLLQGTTSAKQFWIAEIQSALAEGALSRRMKRIKYTRGTIRIRRNGRTINASTLLPSLNPPAVEKEQGLKWKKRRWK
eukprot:scaffold121288_cov49-Cyclotella_meneghiniana.AAC.1